MVATQPGIALVVATPVDTLTAMMVAAGAEWVAGTGVAVATRTEVITAATVVAMGWGTATGMVATEAGWLAGTAMVVAMAGWVAGTASTSARPVVTKSWERHETRGPRRKIGRGLALSAKARGSGRPMATGAHDRHGERTRTSAIRPEGWCHAGA